MAVTLHIGLDLGSDTLKIAFAYKDAGETSYGKLMKDSLPTQVAIPAVAYYDEDSDEWLYGSEVDKTDGGTFVNVVKIKSLLSLLLRKPDAYAVKNNRMHYFDKTDFPKFYFPARRGMLDDFEKMVEQDMTFCAKNSTPQSVCEGFFKYVYRLIEECVGNLAAHKKIKFDPEYKVALVHSARINKIYIDELTRLIQVSFGTKPNKILGSTKALSMYAYWRKVLKEGERLLVFDMGEKDISVAQATLMKGTGLAVDGVDGHNGPCELGGNDIDDSIAEFIESTIYGRETVGTPSQGVEGHICERGLHSKQYLFTKDIKKAKMILSMPLEDNELFANGVPISLSRDLHIQRRLTIEEFESCVGIDSDSGVAREIADYIVSELERVVNNNVHKIFLSGGVVETYGIIDYIKGVVSRECTREIEVLTFDDFNDDEDGFNILSYEDSVYAPSVGGAIVSLQNYNVATVTALSYGTWVGIDKYRCLDIFLNRGTPLKSDSNLFTTQIQLGNNSGKGVLSVDDEIYSVAITEDEIRNKKNYEKLKGNYYTDDDRNIYLLIGKRDSELRRNAEKFVQLKVVSGNESNAGIRFRHKGSANGSWTELNGGGILFKHRGEYVKIFGHVGVCEGAKIDKYGHAVPYLSNNSTKNSGYINIQYPDGKCETVLKTEIEPVFFGMDDFDSSAE